MSDTLSNQPLSAEGTNDALKRYYQFHSKIYDSTRWSFLFGRDALIEKVARLASPKTVLEVGCGTGKNLLSLAAAFPNASLTGLDLSAEMIDVARKNLAAHSSRVSFLTIPYTKLGGNFDLIVLSYALTMINPGWDSVIETAATDLSPNGLVAVVDFHNSALPAFKRWMGVNHVRMESHLLPKLTAVFTPKVSEVRNAYLGVWQYVTFIGSKR